MSNAAKVAGTAANTLTTPLNVEEVFSTYLYDGTSSTQTITNGIDLDGEGGLVWTKARTSGVTSGNSLFDTERGVHKWLIANTTSAELTYTNTVTAFNSNGFTLGNNNQLNYSGEDYVSWTFRKAPKFFDVVTYTGDGTSGRTVSHNLGSVPGMMIVRSSAAKHWIIYHRDVGNTKYLRFTTSAELTLSSVWNNTSPTSTEFTLGNAGTVNENGATYVAYLFAHNDGDGEFGPDGDADIIKCGVASYPVSGDVEVNLGWEPQWVLLKDINHSGQPWWIIDTMRGWAAQETAGTLSSTTGGKWEALFANTSGAEVEYDYGGLTSTGFKLPSNNNYGDGNTNYIYIAIRRGPMAVPESATDVFHIDDQSTSISEAPRYRSGFVTDFYFWKEKHTATDWTASTRLLNTNILKPNLTNAETSSSIYTWDFMNGALNVSSVDANKPAWMWKRAPNFFDAVAYTGDGTSNRAIEHNLGVTPEMIWVKARNISYDWVVKHKDLGRDELTLNATTAAGGNLGADFWGSGTDTSTVFHTANSGTNRNTNGNNDTYIAYLFASLDGISKVGSYTGNGSNQTIDCGFSAGARFILIKRTDSTGDWYVWDTERGIVAANDPHLSLNTTAAEVTTNDSIDPDNSGFIVNQVSATNINVSSATYIFYAIA